MASKKFPYKAAYVACNKNCRVNLEDPCRYGCVGCGQCVENCRFDAIHINAAGVAEIDEEKCMACGKCVKVCPREVILIHEIANYIAVTCSNREPGAAARSQCETSCIGCGLCEKTCTAGAITVRENLAHIKEDLCLSCGMCAVKCPRGAIADLRGILA